MFPILKNKKEIEDMKEKGLVEGKDFIVGSSYGITKGFLKYEEPQERWEISFPRILT